MHQNDILLENLTFMKTSFQTKFSQKSGISVITVENAYEQLMAEGYIYSIPKKGFYVPIFVSWILQKTPSVGPDNALLSIKESSLSCGLYK